MTGEAALSGSVPSPDQPGPAGQHAQPAKGPDEVGDGSVLGQASPLAQQGGPVMLAAADQRKRLFYGVTGVHTDIQKAFAEPEDAKLPAEPVTLAPQMDGANSGYQKLENSSAQHHDEAPEETQEHVTGFVKRQV